MDEKIEILLIEDNLGDAGLIEEMLEEFADFPYELKNVETLKEGLSLLKERPFKALRHSLWVRRFSLQDHVGFYEDIHTKQRRAPLIMTDLRLPDSDGINTFLSICNQNSLIPIIILTGLKDETIGTYAKKEGAHDYLVKGQTESRLLECIIQCSIKCKNRLYSDY